MGARLQELKRQLFEVYDLNMAGSVLRWDQATYMPSGGAPARGRQLALLGRIAHERFTDSAVGKLIEDAARETQSLPADSDDASLVRVTRRDYDQAVKMPSSLIAEMNEHFAASYQEWTEAKPANDFARLRPLLEKTLTLSRRVADCFPGYDNIADPLIDFSDYGMKAAGVRTLFGELRSRLVPLARAIAAQPPVDDRCIRQHTPRKRRWRSAKT